MSGFEIIIYFKHASPSKILLKFTKYDSTIVRFLNGLKRYKDCRLELLHNPVLLVINKALSIAIKRQVISLKRRIKSKISRLDYN